MFNDHVLHLHLLSQLSITFGNRVFFCDISLFQNLTLLILRLTCVVSSRSGLLKQVGILAPLSVKAGWHLVFMACQSRLASCPHGQSKQVSLLSPWPVKAGWPIVPMAC